MRVFNGKMLTSSEKLMVVNRKMIVATMIEGVETMIAVTKASSWQDCLTKVCYGSALEPSFSPLGRVLFGARKSMWSYPSNNSSPLTNPRFDGILLCFAQTLRVKTEVLRTRLLFRLDPNTFRALFASVSCAVVFGFSKASLAICVAIWLATCWGTTLVAKTYFSSLVKTLLSVFVSSAIPPLSLIACTASSKPLFILFCCVKLIPLFGGIAAKVEKTKEEKRGCLQFEPLGHGTGMKRV